MGFADIHGLLMQMVQPLLPMEIFFGIQKETLLSMEKSLRLVVLLEI